MAAQGARLFFFSAFAFLLLTAPYAGAQVTCASAARNVLPCRGYLLKQVQTPPQTCCDGVAALNSAAKRSTPAALRDACLCLKKIASGLTGLDGTRIGGIVSYCKVSPPFAISINVDCATIK